MGRRNACPSFQEEQRKCFSVKKTNTQAFSNLVGGLIFLAIGIWALVKTYSFQVIKNAYVQPAQFPQIMSTGLIIFSAAVTL